MKNNKWYVISTFVLGCIVINFAGRILSDRLQLPLWLDSFGTVTAAYVLGPFCGAYGRDDGKSYLWDFIFLDKYVLRSGQCHGRHNDRHMCEKRIFKKSLWSTFNKFFNSGFIGDTFCPA